MVSFALKGAVVDYDQLAARADYLTKNKLPLCLELHSFGPRDVYDPKGRQQSLDNLSRLADTFGAVDLTFHIPFQNVKTVTEQDFDAAQVEESLAFAAECQARRVVMHRYWGMVYGEASPRSDRVSAIEGFNETVISLARSAPEITLLVENMGHYFLASKRKGDYLSGPLDHFFPWEIDAFRKAMSDHGVKNAKPFVDVAHATLSSNLFNYLRAHRNDMHDAPMFQGILDEDLDRAESLHPFDFVDPLMPWLHVSDSVFLEQYEEDGLPQQALTNEGLEIGAGNLPFVKLPGRLEKGAVDTILVLEVDPAEGETYVENKAQCRSLDRLRKFFALD